MTSPTLSSTRERVSLKLINLLLFALLRPSCVIGLTGLVLSLNDLACPTSKSGINVTAYILAMFYSDQFKYLYSF